MILASICLMSTMSIIVSINLEVPGWIAICQFISFVPCMSFYLCPMQVSGLIFGETVANLCSWCTILTNDIKSGTDLPKSLDNCKALIGLLNNTSQLFSTPLTYTVVVLMTGSICNIYQCIAFFFGVFDSTKWYYYGLVFGYFCSGIVMLQYIIYLVNIAARIEQRIHLLINAVVDCKCLDSEAKNQALHYLKSFTGFSAMGFFHLKKSLLSSIAVNFITYLIILMQFKVSEK
jgi:hypothetical protein